MEEKKINKFNFYTYFWIFFIGSIFGFIYESILSYFQFGHVINKQELLFGPFMPVYGIGGIVFLYISNRYKSLTMIFILTTLFGSIVEYLYSFMQEYLFSVLSWDYSFTSLNINGRITLLYSLGWGILGIISCKFFIPYIKKFILCYPKLQFKVTSYILIIFMIFNISITSIALYRKKQRYFNIPPQNILSKIIDKYYPDSKMEIIFQNQKNVYDKVKSSFSNVFSLK